MKYEKNTSCVIDGNWHTERLAHLELLNINLMSLQIN